MSTCRSCSAQLQSEWKFCIHCGTPALPGAIRPEPIDGPRRPSLLVTFGILVGAIVALGLGATLVALMVGSAIG